MPLSTIALQGAALRALYRLPRRIRRLIAGAPIRLDDQELALDAQLFLRARELSTLPALSKGTPEKARRDLDKGAAIAAGEPIEPVAVRELTIDGTIPARLYQPDELPEGSPLLVFFHGGGFTIGSITSHDNTCRFLAKHARVRVLSVGYRLAPEHPFPDGVDDAVAAFKYAHANAAELGADPAAIAVGGDSAGGNLATVVSQLTTRAGGPKPAFQLLLYPSADATSETRSKQLFAKGFFLTRDDMDWFMGHYARTEQDKQDPRYSPGLATDLSGMPPAYIATAGFDPLRDEGEAYAESLRKAGVPVVLTRHADLIHGYANFLAIGTRFREAMFEAAAVLRVGLEISPKESVGE
ncbi:alpha/beta hydrolase [Kibdelosporangium philippinense]|uniref:Alpha/beta hydrolase n=1 Tax=Kibdelosporangium philippinense TaxID=211113 RepID=A0ABS8ZNV0_9PSEU|nr:alpha/beta hydrolase [Kibdelosporangium philippinense]MCE7009395.1 alpha/beta hydrolase [Kibdelosporangium philippinense]